MLGQDHVDPSTAIADTKFHSNTEVLAYVRSFDVGGQSAKFDVIPGVVVLRAGNRERPAARARDVGPRRPAISRLVQFAWSAALANSPNYKQDLIVGVSLQVSAPLGQYDDSKLLNLGNNRWSFRPELGISKAWGPWTFEVAPSVTFFSRNNADFISGNTFTQAPIYAVQGHILYTFQSGVWMALDENVFARAAVPLSTARRATTSRRARGRLHPRPADRHPKLSEAVRQHRHYNSHRQRI